MEQTRLNELEQKIEKMAQDLEALNNEIYKNNFSTYQEFNKRSNFTSGLRIPSSNIIPTTGEKSELIEVGGKLYICSSSNTWTLVGSQT